MDSLGGDVQVVSPYVDFYNYQLDTTVAVATSRAINGELGEMTRTWPARTEAREHAPQPPSAYPRKFYYDCIVYTEKDAILWKSLERLLGL